MRQQVLLLIQLFAIGFSSFAQTNRKLSDTLNIAFARNVKNYRNVNIDSLIVDIYYPPDAVSTKKYPMILFCHAGGFTGGDRTNVSSECDMFSDEGFIAATLDYRIGYNDRIGKCNEDTLSLNEAIYRALQDVNACLRFITANADAFSIDTSKLFLGGASAGATLTLHDQYLTDSVAKIYWPSIYNKLGGTQTSGNTIPLNYTLKGLCVMWGGMPDYNLITKQSGIPAILFKGGLDDNLPNGHGYFKGCTNYPPCMAGIGIYNDLAAANIPCVYHFNPLAPHAAYDDLFCIRNTVNFFNALSSGTAYSGFYTYYKPSGN